MKQLFFAAVWIVSPRAAFALANVLAVPIAEAFGT
jgi:hypothetical protein